jgi:hypothetical protein
MANELPRSKLRGIKPPLAYSHGPASLAGEMLTYLVDALYGRHVDLRITLTVGLGMQLRIDFFRLHRI